MNYSKKMKDAIIFLSISMIIIPSLTYFFYKYIPVPISVIVAIIFPLIGYILTHIALKDENKTLFLFSAILYNIILSSFIGGFYRAKSLQIAFLEVLYVTMFYFIVMVIIYFLFTKFRNRVAPAFICLFVIALSITIAILLYKYSILSGQLKIYMLMLLVEGILHYFIALYAMKKDISMIKAISVGYWIAFIIIANFATDGTFGLPDTDNKKES